jgi:hypothetical protein
MAVPDVGRHKFVRNIRNHAQIYTASQYRTLQTTRTRNFSTKTKTDFQKNM